MRIAIMGAGGTGGFFGGLLARAGNDVTFVARGAHLNAMQTSGLTIKSRSAGDFTIPVQATSNPTGMEPVDLVLFCVKTYDTETAAQVIRPIVAPDTVVFSVQNGIDNGERISRTLNAGQVMCGVANIFAGVEAPGVIAHRSTGLARIMVGEWDRKTSPRVERLLQTFQKAGIEGVHSPDIQLALWEKFLGICGNSGVSSLTRLPIGPILACPETKSLFRQTLQEVYAVARAKKVGVPEDAVERWIGFCANLPPGVRPSMANDLAAGRRMELESLNGTVVRMGREQEVATPCNFAIYAALKPFVNGAPQLP
ncbi:MAG: 2-dehydropantoate 2-reductase [SAR202 cluster bacterium]|nr:2-dehydropantoate 2-reductase [SAR202 cluster bacterium]